MGLRELVLYDKLCGSQLQPFLLLSLCGQLNQAQKLLKVTKVNSLISVLGEGYVFHATHLNTLLCFSNALTLAHA